MTRMTVCLLIFFLAGCARGEDQRDSQEAAVVDRSPAPPVSTADAPSFPAPALTLDLGPVEHTNYFRGTFTFDGEQKSLQIFYGPLNDGEMPCTLAIEQGCFKYPATLRVEGQTFSASGRNYFTIDESGRSAPFRSVVITGSIVEGAIDQVTLMLADGSQHDLAFSVPISSVPQADS